MVLALIDAGFVWGGVRTTGFAELGDDPMHFQQAIHPEGARYREIVSSGVAQQDYERLRADGRLPAVGSES